MGRLTLLPAVIGIMTLACSGNARAPAQGAEPQPAQQQALKHLKGSRVSLWLPPGVYRPTRALSLFVRNPVLRIDLGEFTAGTADETQEFMAALKSEQPNVVNTPVTRGKAVGFVETWSQGPESTKRALVLSSGPAVALIGLTYQEGGETLARRITESVVLDADAPLDPATLHGISIGDLAGFEVLTHVSHPILFGERGAPRVKPATAAWFSLAVLSTVRPGQCDECVKEILVNGLRDYKASLQSATPTPFELSGRPAVAVTTTGENEGEPVAIYSFLATRHDSSVLGLGTVGVGTAPELMPRLERLVHSIKLDDGILGPLD